MVVMLMKIFFIKYWRIALLVVSALALSGLFFGFGYAQGLRNLDNNVEKKIELHESGYRFISPLLECQTRPSYRNNLLVLKRELEDSIDEAADKNHIFEASVYLRDLNNGPWIGINESAKFSPASLMKVPIMISYFKWAEFDPSILKKKIKVVLDAEDTFSQNIIPSEVVVTGQEYTVEDLIIRMLKYSDNLAANTLIQNADLDLLDKVYFDLGIHIPLNGGENFLTVHDYASFFRILYNSSYLNREMSELALKILSQTEYQEGIVAGVPSYVTVAHKFGERRVGDALQLHDCGIIYRANNPYLLCVMTRGDNFTEMKSLIQELSAKTFQSYGVGF